MSLVQHAAQFARSSDAVFVVAQLLLSRLLFVIPGVLTAGVVAGGERGWVTLTDLEDLARGAAGRLLCNADCGWYLDIVANGYHPGPFAVDQQHNWAFFPLFPGLVTVAGGTIYAGIAVSVLATCVACLLLSREVRARYGRRVARWTILFLLYWPFSGVLTAFRPEALVLLGTVTAWSAAGRQRWWIAWLGVAIATMSRPTGILAAILVIAEISRAGRMAAVRNPHALAGALLPLGGLGAFMVFLYLRTGNAFAFTDIQVTWDRALINPGVFAERYLSTPWFIHGYWDFTLVNMLVLAIGALAAARLWARRDWWTATYTLASILASPVTGGQLISLGRYAATTFTIPLVGATDPRLRRMRPALLVTSAVGLALVGSWLALGSNAAAA